EADRGEQQAAVMKGMVPVTLDEDAASRGPDVTGWRPYPALAEGQPVPRPPDVALLLPDPAAGDVETAGIGSRSRWAALDGFGRRRDVRHLLLILRGPEAADPAPAPVLRFFPEAGHPASAGRGLAPGPADPEELLLLCVPGPVARQPDDIVALRLLFGGQFLN